MINLFVRASYAARRSAASLTERAGIISSLSKIYFCDYYIDLSGDRFLELDATDELRAYVGRRGGASKLLADSCRYFAEPEYVEDFLAFTDLTTLQNRLAGRQSITFEFVCRDSGWCRATFIAVDQNEEGRAGHVIYALQHIQEEKERELKTRQALEAAADRANRANRAKSDFLSRMSHDIRTPLNGIIGMAYLAGKEDNPPKTADCLAKIDTSSRFLLGLINDILDMSKAESDGVTLQPEPYPPEEFYGYLDSVIRPLCREKNQRFSVDSVPAEGRVPVMDKLHFNQIIFNLLSNAVKYTPEGGEITYRAVFRQLDEAGRLGAKIQVADTGIGISTEFQKRLFEPFTQEGRSDIAANRGSGLGLAIAKRMVELMGGTISVESRVGEGTTFTVELTVDSVSASSCGAGQKPAGDGDFSALQGAHVLLCEDHPLNQEIARALLAEKGIYTEIAENGQQGVERFKNAPFRFYSAVLMDIRMPVMDGYEAARTIRGLDRSDAKMVPIIAMTADAFEDDVSRCLAVGMNGHVAKPVEPEKLFAALLSAMGENDLPPDR